MYFENSSFVSKFCAVDRIETVTGGVSSATYLVFAYLKKGMIENLMN